MLAVEGEMSYSAAHQSKGVRHNCQSCRARKARFQYRGIVKADRDHVLCFECYRSEVNRHRAMRLVGSPFGRVLSEGELEHRRRMVAHLAIFRPFAASSPQ